MTADAIILTAGAVTVYTWLCAIVAPVAFAFNRLFSTRGARRAWIVLTLAAGSAMLWTAVAAGIVLLGIVLVPSAGLALLLSPFTIPGVSLGVTLWGFQTLITARVPRLGPAFEVETALALASLLTADRRLLTTLERLYTMFLIEEAPFDALAQGRPIRALRPAPPAGRSRDVYRVTA
jgi:hypothetical protein